jgi:hypothetical protein
LLLVDLDVEADVDLYIEVWEPGRATIVTSDIVLFSASATFDTRRNTLDDLSLGTIGVDLDELVRRNVSW